MTNLRKKLVTEVKEEKDDPIYFLVRGIIKQACVDYAELCRPGKPEWLPKGKPKAEEMRKIERWLRATPLLALYCDVDPEYIIEKLKKDYMTTRKVGGNRHEAV